MTSEESSELSLAFARVLYVNGQATDQVVAAIRRLGNKFGIKAELLPRWGELQLRAEAGAGTPTSYVAADPTGVDMDRVVSAMQAIADIESGRLSTEEAHKRIEAVAKAPPAPAWLFALAAAVGGVAPTNARNPPGSRSAGFRILAEGFGAVETAIESQLLPGS